jgi:anti-sigma B factor antagonist
MSENQLTQNCRLSLTSQDGFQVVSITGSLADSAVLAAKEDLCRLLEQKPGRIVIDLEDLEYISSSGIGLLVSILRRCRQGGVGMGLCNLRPEIQELFKLTRLNQVFEIHENRAAAMKAKAKV